MRGHELVALMLRKGCVKLRQKGSHVVMRCGLCRTVVPVHKGKDIPPGLLRRIDKDIEPCLGKGWMNE